MADLNPLIRVRKHTVEQKQKFLSQLYRQAEDLDAEKKGALDRLAEERENVKEMQIEMLSYFGPYTEAVKERVADIDDARSKLETRIEIAREDMRTAYAELKKIEITQERREVEDKKSLDKKESDELDEIGLEVFRRQDSEQS